MMVPTAPFAVLYRWRLHPGAEADFIDAWSRISERLRDERGSLGSRLHQAPDGWFWSYAQWPSADARAAAFAAGSVDAEAGRRMHAAIAETLPEQTLRPLADFLLAPRANRSMPAASVIPVLEVPDVAAAAEWLRRAFGFRLTLRIGRHRAQLALGNGDLVIAEGLAAPPAGASMMVRIADADAHCATAEAAGACITARPATQPFGERQYGAIDPFGHRWTFSQTVADIDPADWGGERP